jgi:hypothetical protein
MGGGGGHFKQENVYFGYILVYSGGNFSLISSSVLINIYKMDFDTKAFDIILVIFQMNVIFQQNIFFNTIMIVSMKNLFICFF